MYIATNEAMMPQRNVLSIFPISLRRSMYNINFDEAEEIRLIQGKPISVKYPDGNYCISSRGVLCRDEKMGICTSQKLLYELLERVTKSSLYSAKDEIKNGYITIEGGHRIGIAGTAVTEDGKVDFIKNISAMTIRLATEIIGASDGVICNIYDGEIKNTIIISPPGCGKTTLLRDIVRNISQKGLCVAIADERCEIAAMNNGESPFDIGGHTIVMENCPKSFAMTALLRSMSPDVIVTDELGDDKDAEAVSKIVNCGVGVIATAHGRDIKQLENREVFKKLLQFFDVAIILSRKDGVGTIERVEKLC